MPKSTFINLSEEKKNAIELILIDVYSKNPATLVTVSDIVKRADFSRAAFYKYFEDIEDAHQYIIRRGTDVTHEKIMRYIGHSRNDFFKGINDYLIHVTDISSEAVEYKVLQILIQNGNTVLFNKENALMMLEDDRMIQSWLKLLAINHFDITDNSEAISFLYFIMALIMDSLSTYLVQAMSAEEMLADFAYKQRWVEHGIKKS